AILAPPFPVRKPSAGASYGKHVRRSCPQQSYSHQALGFRRARSDVSVRSLARRAIHHSTFTSELGLLFPGALVHYSAWTRRTCRAFDGTFPTLHAFSPASSSGASHHGKVLPWGNYHRRIGGHLSRRDSSAAATRQDVGICPRGSLADNWPARANRRAQPQHRGASAVG